MEEKLQQLHHAIVHCDDPRSIITCQEMLREFINNYLKPSGNNPFAIHVLGLLNAALRNIHGILNDNETAQSNNKPSTSCRISESTESTESSCYLEYFPNWVFSKLLFMLFHKQQNIRTAVSSVIDVFAQACCEQGLNLGTYIAAIEDYMTYLYQVYNATEGNPDTTCAVVELNEVCIISSNSTRKAASIELAVSLAQIFRTLREMQASLQMLLSRDLFPLNGIIRYLDYIAPSFLQINDANVAKVAIIIPFPKSIDTHLPNNFTAGVFAVLKGLWHEHEQLYFTSLISSLLQQTLSCLLIFCSISCLWADPEAQVILESMLVAARSCLDKSRLDQQHIPDLICRESFPIYQLFDERINPKTRDACVAFMVHFIFKNYEQQNPSVFSAWSPIIYKMIPAAINTISDSDNHSSSAMLLCSMLHWLSLLPGSSRRIWMMHFHSDEFVLDDTSTQPLQRRNSKHNFSDQVPEPKRSKHGNTDHIDSAERTSEDASFWIINSVARVVQEKTADLNDLLTQGNQNQKKLRNCLECQSLFLQLSGIGSKCGYAVSLSLLTSVVQSWRNILKYLVNNVKISETLALLSNTLCAFMALPQVQKHRASDSQFTLKSVSLPDSVVLFAKALCLLPWLLDNETHSCLNEECGAAESLLSEIMDLDVLRRKIYWPKFGHIESKESCQGIEDHSCSVNNGHLEIQSVQHKKSSINNSGVKWFTGFLMSTVLLPLHSHTTAAVVFCQQYLCSPNSWLSSEAIRLLPILFGLTSSLGTPCFHSFYEIVGKLTNNGVENEHLSILMSELAEILAALMQTNDVKIQIVLAQCISAYNQGFIPTCTLLKQSHRSATAWFYFCQSNSGYSVGINIGSSSQLEKFHCVSLTVIHHNLSQVSPEEINFESFMRLVGKGTVRAKARAVKAFAVYGCYFPFNQALADAACLEGSPLLSLLEEESMEVLSELSPCFGTIAPKLNASARSLLLQKLRSSAENLQVMQFTDRLEYLVDCIAACLRSGEEQEDEEDLPFLTLLIFIICLRKTGPAAFAVRALESYSTRIGKPISDIIQMHIIQVSQELLMMLPETLISDPYMQFLTGRSAQTFFSETLEYTLPFCFRSKNASALQKLAKLVGRPLNMMSVNHAGYIFSNIFIHAQPHEVDGILKFFEEHVKESAESVITISRQQILYGLMMEIDPKELEQKRERWEAALKALMKYTNEGNGLDRSGLEGIGGLNTSIVHGDSKHSTPKEQTLQAFIREHLLAMLTLLRARLVSRTYHSQRRAIAGFLALIRIVGKQDLEAMCIPALQLILNGLSVSGIEDLALQACLEFVQIMPTHALKSILVQLAVGALKLAASHSKLVSRVLIVLINSHKDLFSQYCQTIISIPTQSDFSPVRQLVGEISQHQFAAESQPLALVSGKLSISSTSLRHIEQLCEALEHDASEVRAIASSKLEKLLQKQRQQRTRNSIFDINPTDPNVDPNATKAIKRLLSAVLNNCRSMDITIRRRSGHCLSLFGAIDPSTLGQIPLHQRHSDSFTTSVSDTKFAVHLISSHLMRGLLSAESISAQDRAALAMQECLKEFGCTPTLSVEDTSHPAPLFWHELEKPVRLVALPFVTSGYRWQASKWQQSLEYSGQPFCQTSSSFSEWIEHWTFYMIKGFFQPEQDNCMEGRIFRACHGVMRDKPDLAMFLVPYMVCQIIKEINNPKPALVDQVFEELEAILSVHRMRYPLHFLATITHMDTCTQGIKQSCLPLPSGDHTNDISCCSSISFETTDKHPGFQKRDDKQDSLLQCSSKPIKTFQRVNSRSSWDNQKVDRHSSQIRTKLVFAIVDYLARWCSCQWKHLGLSHRRKRRSHSRNHLPQDLQNVQAFLQRLPQDLLTMAAFDMKDYTRVLKYGELYFRKQKKYTTIANKTDYLVEAMKAGKPAASLSESDSHTIHDGAANKKPTINDINATVFLCMQQSHMALRNIDAVVGAARQAPSVQSVILGHRAAGRWSEALACYEQGLQTAELRGGSRLFYHCGLIECQLRLGLLDSAFHSATRLAIEADLSEDMSTAAQNYWIEAAWKLGKWDSIDQFQFIDTTKEYQHDFNLHMTKPQNMSNPVRSAVIQGIKDISRLSCFSCKPSFYSFTLQPSSSVPAHQHERHNFGSEVGNVTHIDMSNNTLIQENPHLTLQARFALLCNAARHKNEQMFDTLLQAARDHVLEPLIALSSTACDAYAEAYPQIVQLQMLEECDEFAREFIFLQSAPQLTTVEIDALETSWEDSYCKIKPGYEDRDMILSLRRSLIDLLKDCAGRIKRADPAVLEKLCHLQGKLWLETARGAMESRMLDTAYNAMLRVETASTHVFSGAMLDRANLEWERGNVHDALAHLEEYLSKNSHQGETSKYRNAQLLAGEWKTYTGYSTSEEVLEYYSGLVKPEYSTQGKSSFVKGKTTWVEAHYALAKYYDSLLENDASLESKLPIIIHHYGRSLHHSASHTFQALPRLLTLWLMYGVRLPETSEKTFAVDKSMPPGDTKILSAINEEISRITNSVPSFQFLTAITHMSSHICHPNKSVFKQLSAIFHILLQKHLQQTFWRIIGLSNSSFNYQVRRFKELMSKCPRLNKPIRSKITEIAHYLLAICNCKLTGDKVQISLSSDLRLKIPQLDGTVILPTTEAMTVLVPPQQIDNLDDYDPFTSNIPTITGISDQVQVIASLQKPRKIMLIASDGERYPFLCKPEDDLRKDMRVMDVNTIMNKLLKKDPDARERHLHIRTYGIVPLNEKCGLIEWIPNLTGLRNEVHAIYKSRGRDIIYSTRKLLDQNAYPKVNGKMFTKEELFVKFVLPRFPPVLSKWFLSNFPEPTRWYAARQAFMRTSAVMSMIGYILGLGDRHGENLLLDSKTGDVFHVDYNCLFDRGATLQVPECVPFRLTPNMVEALGQMGVEGGFRHTCEVTMRLIRKERDSVINVLETLVNDPGVEMATFSRDTPRTYLNAQALKHIGNVKNKVRGATKSGTTGLSVEAQVDRLIHEATSPANLSRMYIGWAPYI